MKKELKEINEKQKIIKIDFTGCKTWWEYHERIRIAFDFPEWYGRNWDAFWDLLWSDCDADKVEIIGEHTLGEGFKDYIEMTHQVLDDMVVRCKQSPYDNFEYEIID